MDTDSRPTSQRLQKLRQRQEKVKRDIAKEQGRLVQQARKDDTRRKIIAGALALTHRDENPDSEFAAILDRLLNRYVERDNERALFGLEPRAENDNAQRPQSNAAQAKARMEQFARENETA